MEHGVAGETRFVVGIDLGTTNSAIAWAPLRGDARPAIFSVPQVTASGECEARDTLPSCHYEPLAEEFPALRLPWQQDLAGGVVGVWARQRGSELAGRTVFSAKSWLSHRGVDRTAAILPWHAAPGVHPLSPVDVSAVILRHLRDAWNHAHPDAPLGRQEVVVTIPASFDEVARELTVQAAKAAGLRRIHLVEEPQAAFYAWLQGGPAERPDALPKGALVLVCDVGGGTTDFTLIEVRGSGPGREFFRTAVGEHLILGGDNLDLALALEVERRLGEKPGPGQWAQLLARCREAKELLLGPDPPESATIQILGAGRGVVGAARRIEIGRDEAEALLLDGFLPRVAAESSPAARASGLRESGLPYAADAAITRHLAAFLRQHAGGRHPDHILMNGGFFESPRVRTRLLEVLASWHPQGRAPEVLENPRRDLAVALGAASHGLARAGLGRKIAGGLVHAHYVGVERGKEIVALCVAPAGFEEGRRLVLDRHPLELAAGRPVEFPVFVSSLRTTDEAGALVPVSPEELRPLPPLRTVIKSRDHTAAIPVVLAAELTPVGTLDLRFAERGGPRTWSLRFDVRSAARTDVEAHTARGETAGVFDDGMADAGAALIREAFAAGGNAATEQLVKRLESACGLGRWEWPPVLMRRWWDALAEASQGARRTAASEERWLNLCGFLLRPGYGVAVDDHRIDLLWKHADAGPAHARSERASAEWWIMWRRVAGGLSTGRQKALADRLRAPWRKSLRSRSVFGSHEREEVIRLWGALESLPQDAKIEVGGQILAEIAGGAGGRAHVWALGRLGARQPAAGPLNCVIPPDTAAAWADALPGGGAETHLAIALLCRFTGDRFRDVPDDARRRAAARLRDPAPHLADLVERGGNFDDEEQGRVLGDRLPAGLRLA